MSVESALRELLKLDAFPSKEILERFVVRTMERLNALYESVTDQPAPGAGTQRVSGHDHSLDFGGSPIPRSCVLSVDTGDAAQHTGSKTKNQTPDVYTVGPRYISPGIAQRDASTSTDIMVRVAVWGNPIVMWANGEYENRITIDVTGENSPRWVNLTAPVLYDDVFQYLNLTMNWGGPQGSVGNATTAYWKIYAVNEAETWTHSIKDIGFRYVHSNVGALGTLLEYFGNDATLDSDLAASLETLDAYTLKILFWSLNALYTHTMDSYPPGGTSQRIRGHDHHTIADGGDGGRPIPRGCIYYAGSPGVAWQESTCTVLNQWEYTDLDLAYRRLSTGTPNAATGAGATIMWEAYVSEGMNSTGNPPTSNPYLVAQVYTGLLNNADLRIYNATTGTLSPVVNVTTASFPDGWVQINKVPCQGGTWNDFTLQIRSTSTVPTTYDIRQVALFECYSDGDATQNATVITSGGSGAAGVSRSGTQKVPLGGLP